MNVQTVLIADDDLDDIELLKEAIVEYSSTIEISYVTDGEQLMNKLLAGSIPDILILDLNMPCKEGKECLCEIKEYDHLKDLVIVVYSTIDMPALKEECLALGARHFVTKPYQMSGIMKLGEALTTGAFDFV
jgi:CheY-like chemotaxis protein